MTTTMLASSNAMAIGPGPVLFGWICDGDQTDERVNKLRKHLTEIKQALRAKVGSEGAAKAAAREDGDEKTPEAVVQAFELRHGPPATLDGAIRPCSGGRGRPPRGFAVMLA